MKTTLSVFALASLFLLGALRGQNAAPPSPAVTVSGPTERLSTNTSKAVAAGITFQPPKPVEKKPEPVEDEDDAPKNGIIRLPKYVLEADRPPMFRERDINRSKGLAEIAVNRYFNETGKALNRFSIPFVGLGIEQQALMMYEEEERLKNMKDAAHNVYILRQTDPVAADQLKREVDQTFIRRSEFAPVSSSAKAK